MARQMKNDAMKPKHLIPDTMEFCMFTADEIRKLCVTKICTPLTFDNLGYPLSGGLYDKTLGPLSDKADPCETCFKNVYSCPGHFGYIELPLPVANPIFNKIVATILKISCLSCFSIQIPTHIKHSLTVQIKLLNCGLVTEAIDIENKIQEVISQFESMEKVPEDFLLPTIEYEALADRTMSELDGKIVLNKNTESLRNQFINGMLKQVKQRKNCMQCRLPMDRLQTLKNRIILNINRNKVDMSKSGSSREMLGKIKVHESKFLTPEDSRKYMRSIWEKEKELILQLVPVLKKITCEHPTDIFFFEVIPVPPPNLRPVNFVKNRLSENPQTFIYKSILQNSMLLRAVIQVVKSKGDVNSLPAEAKGAYSFAPGKSPLEKLNNVWEALQFDVNHIVDKDPNMRKSPGQGLKQIIEKKAGIIRQHMMGKRVNYAARSVITPDPNLNVDEIGVPEEFAKRLTYPVPVTSWNVEELRKMILNGPNVHPGAVMVEFEDGHIFRIHPSKLTQQESILKRLLTPDEEGNVFRGVKLVYRHLCNGDIMLLNRQPTLHKPSIMAHTARILKGEKTLRLHYANCKAYNADFDGDEMNAHFPQNELARSEGYNIANVCHQYLVPKDGTPLSGLIQDHMVSGVHLSIRGKFFSKNDYQQLVYQALSFKMTEIDLLPPTIRKPATLWSGKQILSTVIINIIPKGKVPINLTATSKISSKAWEVYPPRPWKAGGSPLENANSMTEAEVIIRNGELLTGVLDKTHYGATPYGLIHCMYELYGGVYATKLLSSFAKLFTCFLQREGFTLGVHDILVLADADKKRSKIIEQSRKIGHNTITTALDLPKDTDTDKIVEKIEEKGVTDLKIRAIIDRQYKSALDSFTNDINKTCLPAGLICKFPQNNLQLMVQSGAKGSTVNTMQISCLLGQIELEGKRPPVMISGKSLPSFPAFEFSPRAGGFIDGRFMTGIQPQEFFFHCMAGREGLIDTAVKTSRSGYLQRCLIKHLEGLKVGYDLTVRDSDNSVIQFCYGEDGLDISKAQFLNEKQMEFLSENSKVLINKEIIKDLKSVEDYAKLEEHNDKLAAWIESNGDPLTKNKKSAFTVFSEVIKNKIDLKNPNKVSEKTGRVRVSKYTQELWRETDNEVKDSFVEKCLSCPAPVNSKFQPDSYFGSLNERITSLMNSCKFKKKSQKKEFQNMLKLKAMQSLCAPGEPVGLLAAQSIGEPSTQMTLNTFHFAGRGEMNVTLGIPRLREILMMASKNLKTPSMEIPFLKVPDLEKKAEHLRKLLTRVVVANVLEKICVTRQLDISPIRQQRYVLRFQFLPQKLYKSEYHVKPKYILKHMCKKFFGLMFMAIKKQAKINSTLVSMQEVKGPMKTRKTDDEEDESEEKNDKENAQEAEDSSDEEPEDAEDAKLSNKYRQTHDEQEPQEEDGEISDNDEEISDEMKKSIESTQNSVVDAYNFAQNYSYDTNKHLWCELTFALPLNFKKIDMTAILKDIAAKSVLWETPDIKRAITYLKDETLTLRTDGINMVEMFKYNELLDLNKLYSNDIHKIAETYGIEAALKAIVKEVQDVFKVYGITVDPRHLLLIADYMMYNGTFEPLNRKGMENNPSPLHQMTFESSLTFLKGATIMGKQDQLQNPSSCLIVGKPCNTGTGSFSLLQKLPTQAVAHRSC